MKYCSVSMASVMPRHAAAVRQNRFRCRLASGSSNPTGTNMATFSSSCATMREVPIA